MSALPYFRWYPADAEIDENYASMNDPELGFYHRCLNKSWRNGGIPADMDALADLMKVKRPYLDKIWVKVGKCFTATDTVRPRLVNPRQEKERALAIKKSENNKRVGNANAKGTRTVREAIDPQRAYDSDSDSPPAVDLTKEAPKNTKPSRPPSAPMSARFEDFWAQHPGKKLRKDLAAGVWAHEITTENEDACFACLDRYAVSQEVANRAYMNPENWLSECAAGNFAATWPEAKARDNGQPKLSIAEQAKQLHREQEARKNANG